MKKTLVIAGSILLGFAVLALVVSRLQISSVDFTAGAGAHSQTSKQTACVSLTTASKIPGSLYNGDGSRRILDKVVFYLDDSSGSYVMNNYYGITTSTSATATSTYYGITDVTAFTSSTVPQYVSTSTFSVVLNRVWNTGEYLNLGFYSVASTTGKLCAEYYK